MSELSSHLEASKEAIRRALSLAETELSELDARREELLVAISEARRVLGDDQTAGRLVDSTLTLHKAIEQVLLERGNPWMTARELADEVNQRGLYVKRDRTPVEVNQIHARATNYPTTFEKQSGKIRLANQVEGVDHDVCR
jgi:hypothetical protein